MQSLINELKKYKNICFYPSSGTDISDIDYLCSGKLPYSERVEKVPANPTIDADLTKLPDLFVHTDINFYMEFEEGMNFDASELGFNGDLEILSYEELEPISNPNQINDNYDFSGKVFKYTFKAWGLERIFTLIYILCENEFFVSKIALNHGLQINTIWSKNWAGSLTCGTWMTNVADKLQIHTFYTDWLCIPGKRGEPTNKLVSKQYPELMVSRKVELIRTEKNKWIDEGANGWLEEFFVRKL